MGQVVTRDVIYRARAVPRKLPYAQSVSIFGPLRSSSLLSQIFSPPPPTVKSVHSIPICRARCVTVVPYLDRLHHPWHAYRACPFGSSRWLSIFFWRRETTPEKLPRISVDCKSLTNPPLRGAPSLFRDLFRMVPRHRPNRDSATRLLSVGRARLSRYD